MMLVTQYLDVLKEYTHIYLYLYMYVCIYTYDRGSGAHDAGDAVPGRPEGVRAKALISFIYTCIYIYLYMHVCIYRSSRKALIYTCIYIYICIRMHVFIGVRAKALIFLSLENSVCFNI